MYFKTKKLQNYTTLFPPGKRCTQVSWRQFKFNGAKNNLMFPQIIRSQPTLPHFSLTHHIPLAWDWKVFVRSILTTETPLSSARSSFIIAKSFSSAGNGLEEIVWRVLLKVNVILLSGVGTLKVWSGEQLEPQRTVSVWNRLGVCFNRTHRFHVFSNNPS